MQDKIKDLKKKRIVLILFILYTIIMIWELFLGKYRTFTSDRSYNLIPFKTVMNYISNREKYNISILFINLLANIIVFVPLGFLLPLLKDSINKLSKIVFISFITILGAEVVQFTLKVGIFDVDDIFLNLLGVIIGYFSFKLYSKINKK